jgi:hypothetical protein
MLDGDAGGIIVDEQVTLPEASSASAPHSFAASTGPPHSIAVPIEVSCHSSNLKGGTHKKIRVQA